MTTPLQNPMLASLFHRLNRIRCNAERDEHVKNPALIQVALRAIQQNHDYCLLLTTHRGACDSFNVVAGLCNGKTVTLIVDPNSKSGHSQS